MEIANAVGGNSGAPRTNRVMLEGVGARVIRGPDWKWGKQVRSLNIDFFLHSKIAVFAQFFLNCRMAGKDT